MTFGGLVGSLVAAASLKLQRQSGRPSKAPARGSLKQLQWLRLGGGRCHLGITAAATPSHHHRQGRRRGWRGRAWGAPSVSLQRPPMRDDDASRCLPYSVQATAEAPSWWPAARMRATPPAHRCLCCGGGHSRANKTGFCRGFCVGCAGRPRHCASVFPCLPNSRLRYVKGARFALTHAALATFDQRLDKACPCLLLAVIAMLFVGVG